MITLREEKPLPHAAGPLECSFLCLDKPAGPSSHEATVWARNILGVERGGHAGTLDPIVTGVLPIAIGSAVKLLRALAQSDKEYVCIAKFKRSPEGIEKALREFTGKIYQTPPEESAVKKALRTRAIHGIRLLEVDGTRALFKAKCQHGTYIRTLCKDLGEVMGNACEMEELRRISAGPFSEKDCCTFQELKDFGYEKCLLPPEKGLSNLKKMVVANNAVSAVCHGASLARVGLVALDEGIKKGDMVALFTASNEIIGLGSASKSTEEIVDSSKGFVCSIVAVVMPRELYPKRWKSG